MSLTGLAALIAAVSFAVLAGAAVYLAARFARVLNDAATLVRDTRSDQRALFARANAAVDRASAQLDQTEAATTAVADLGDSMTELAGQASALAGIGKSVAGAVVGGPLGRAAAVVYGVRHAVGLRRGTASRGTASRGTASRGTVSRGAVPQGNALPGEVLSRPELTRAGAKQATGARR